MKKVKINLTKIKNGYRASLYFTFLTKHADNKEDAIKYFVEELKLRNYEIVEKN